MIKIARRLGAYLIDIIVVTVVITLLSRISFLNPYYEKYNDTYDKYAELYSEINDLSREDVLKYREEHIEEINKYSYDLEKYNVYASGITIVIYLLYFVGFNYLTKGQTLGKKLLGLRIADYEDEDKRVGIGNYLIRALLLYGLIFRIIFLILVLSLNMSNYITVYNILYEIQSWVSVIITCMIIIRKDGRGLHDMAAKTVVTYYSDSDKRVKVKEKIIDASFEEVK